MSNFTDYLHKYKTWILANKWLSASTALFLLSFLFSWGFLFITFPFLMVVLSRRFRQLDKFNPVLKKIAIAVIGILAVPGALLPALASPNTWNYINSPETQKSIQASREREAKLAQEKKQQQEADNLEQEKKRQEQERLTKEKQEAEDKAKLEEEKVKATQEAEKKAKDEQIKTEEQKQRENLKLEEEKKKQEQTNQELATKINNDVTFDSEIAAQDVNQAIAANKTIAQFQTTTKDKKTFQVISIADGDTIKLAEIGTVRLIGIDTPETKDPRKPVQCFGQEASNKIGELLTNSSVYLEFDPAQRIDKYGRTLAYVFRNDGLDVNLEMVKQGFAFAYTKYPNPRSGEFVNAQTEAKSKQTGLWLPSTCNGEQKEVKKETPVVVPVPVPVPPKTQTQAPVATPTPVPVTTPTNNATQAKPNCHPSYPDICLPPSGPDLDCKDIPYRRFRVLQPDTYRLDGGKNPNGIGCESD